MKDVLVSAIAPPAEISLGGIAYLLSFPMQAVIIYKRETAKIDRRRSEGKPRLTRDEVRVLSQDRSRLLEQARKCAPPKGEEWDPIRQAEFESLMDEATSIKIQIDEDAGKGDSLFDLSNWRKIGFDVDPERLLLSLWVSLHKFEGDQYKAPIGMQALGQMLNASNAADVMSAITQALISSLVPGDSPKNAQAPAEEITLPAMATTAS